MQILETLIEYSASSLDKPFTYLCPDDTPVCAGMRVEVRFGAMPRPIVGFVLRASHTDEGKEQIQARLGFEVSFISRLIDDKPLLSQELLQLSSAIASYYLCSRISVLQAMKNLGWKGCWNGLGTRILMIGTLTGLQWWIYDTWKTFCGYPSSGGH